MTRSATEVNFDGIVGPTHNFSGLSLGNLASIAHQDLISHPKAAVLQGLEKMKFMHDLGIKQGLIPPHERPHLPSLRALGFKGPDITVIQQVKRDAPELLNLCSSSAAMWTANAATISPSSDSIDGRVHITPANLCSNFHRSIECETTALILKKLFPSEDYFIHHPSMPFNDLFADEGAANHHRFCQQYGAKGVQLFVYGRRALKTKSLPPNKFPARQTFEASQAISRLHGLSSESLIFAQQSPKAIDEGVFHNDVISVGNENLFLYHESAFHDPDQLIAEIQRKAKFPLALIKVTEKEVTLKEAVSTYLFNSQIVTLADRSMAIIAPIECKESSIVADFLNTLIKKNRTPIKAIYYRNLRESMSNGGGPACLRLRFVLNEQELAAVHPQALLTDALYDALVAWAKKYYRDSLSTDDLADPLLLIETQTALDELTKILNLGSIYSFQF